MAETPELAAQLAADLAAVLDDDPAFERHGELETSPWGSGQWVKYTDPAFERHGELETSPWGSGQWVKYTDPDGRVHFLRIVVEPYRQP